MDLATIIAQLESQHSAISTALEALRAVTGQFPAPQRDRSPVVLKTPGTSSEGRRRQIEAMRKYWAAKKAGKGAVKRATKKGKKRTVKKAGA